MVEGEGGALPDLHAVIQNWRDPDLASVQRGAQLAFTTLVLHCSIGYAFSEGLPKRIITRGECARGEGLRSPSTATFFLACSGL